MLHNTYTSTTAATDANTSRPKFEVSPASSFLDKVFDLKEQHKRSKAYLWDVLSKILGLYQSGYKNASTQERVENKQILEYKCEQEKIRLTKDTSVLTMMAKLIVTDNRQLAASYALVLTTADVLGQIESTFVKWLEDAGGIDKVKRTYDATGHRRSVRDAVTPYIRAERGRKRLGTRVVHSIDASLLADSELAAVATDTVQTAIVMLHPDGSLSIRAIVKDKALLEKAYIAYEDESKAEDDDTDATTN
ncbi:hypothetical protein KDW40_15680 [Burkholderia cenocepacia]|uniref:hypothetical protein n=1 Tax=Burkholderia TaxID=32008 RepID=UPI001B927A1B|nr:MULTISPECIES: hypothetical protein [Burkholderia]MBR8327170.1 hypothetical protein [Burkholderia cenocepacia]